MQDNIVDVFITIREDYYGRFVQEISKSKSTSNVSKNAFDKLKNAYASELKKKCELGADKDRAMKIIHGLMEKIKTLESENSNLRSEIEQLKAPRGRGRPPKPPVPADSSDEEEPEQIHQMQREKLRQKVANKKEDIPVAEPVMLPEYNLDDDTWQQ